MTTDIEDTLDAVPASPPAKQLEVLQSLTNEIKGVFSQLARGRGSVLVLASVLLSVLALGACNTPLAAIPAATPTPNAATILQRAAKAKYQDVTFSFAFSTADEGQTITGTGTGAITKNPERMQMTMSFPLTLLGQTETLTLDLVTDVATHTTYSRVEGLAGIPSTWTKSDASDASAAGSVSPIDVTSFTDFTSYTNAKLVGSDTLDGVAVWHLQATPPAQGDASAQSTSITQSTATAGMPTAASLAVDIYIRKDNSYPMKLSAHVGGSTPVDMTITFTKYNSGVTITLPTA